MAGINRYDTISLKINHGGYQDIKYLGKNGTKLSGLIMHGWQRGQEHGSLAVYSPHPGCRMSIDYFYNKKNNQDT